MVGSPTRQLGHWSRDSLTPLSILRLRTRPRNGRRRDSRGWVSTWSAKTHIAPIYSCGPGEAPVLDAVERASGACVRRLEHVGLAQFAAALAGARLFVGNDSGPAHMAAALTRPLVVIFGSSSSPIWGPWPRQDSNPGARVVQNQFDCNPCPGDRCYQFARPECILSVTFDQVKDAVEDVLAQSS